MHLRVDNSMRSQEWWSTPIMPVLWETKVGGSQAQAEPEQLSKTISKF